MLTRTAFAVALVSALAAVACHGAAPAPQKIGPVLPIMTSRLPYRMWYVPGEQMSFEVSYRGLVVGRGRLAAGQPGELQGRPALIVHSELQSAGLGAFFKEVNDMLESTLDLGGEVVAGHSEVRIGDRETIVDSRFPGARVVVQVDRHQVGEQRQQQTSAPRVQVRRMLPQRTYLLPTGDRGLDIHGVLGAVRAWRGTVGTVLVFYGLGNYSLWHNELLFYGAETLETAAGPVRAVRFTGMATRVDPLLRPDRRKPRRFYTLWLSDDQQRVPLRVTGNTEFGEVTVDLTEYRAPVDASARAQ